MSDNEYYNVLGVSRSATEDEVTKAYRKAALRWHPDKNPDNKEEAEVQFKRIGEAYDCLSDPQTRQLYDRFGKQGLEGGSGMSSGPGFHGGYGGRRDAFTIFEQFFGGCDPFAHFDEIFAGMGGPHGRDEETHLPIFDFDEGSAFGDVCVEDAQIVNVGSVKFTTYLIRGTLNGHPFSSRKRYSHFTWFRATLVENLPGIFLPVLPDKQKVGRFDPAFIEDRRLRLQQFLQRIFMRSEICIGLPLVLSFLTCSFQDYDRLKSQMDSRSLTAKFQDFRSAFQETLSLHEPPKSDTGFLMVKDFLDKHSPLLKTAEKAAIALLREQAVLAQRQRELGHALEVMSTVETQYLEKAQMPQTELRRDFLVRFHSGMKTDRADTSGSLLAASLQREEEDCSAMQECLASIEGLQRRLQELGRHIHQAKSSLADLKGESPSRVGDPSGPGASLEASLAEGMRKRDKTKQFFGNIATGVMDISAKAGINKEKRIAELTTQIEKDSLEVALAEEFLAAARTVFSATEIKSFLTVKAQGCMHAHTHFAEKRLPLYQELAKCWSQNDV